MAERRSARAALLPACLALLLAACGTAELPQVALAPAAAGASAAPRLAADSCRDLFVVGVDFPRPDGGGEERLHLILDTGAWTSHLDRDAYRRLAGRPARGDAATLTGGRSGPLRLDRLPVSLHDMGDLSLALGRRVDGILGYSAFGGLLLTLDYPRGEVRVEAGELPPPDGESVWETRGKGRPYLPLDLGERTVAVLVDSGFTGGLTLRPDDPVDWSAAPRPVGAAVRYASVVPTRAGRTSESWALGPATVVQPVVRVADGTRLLGAKLLRHFAWTFDARRQRVRIAAAGEAALSLPPPRGPGVALRPRGSEFEVFAVLPETPAAAAGIVAGDRLLAVDGVPVAARGCVGVTETAGDELRLTLRRDGGEVELPVAVVDLLP